MSIDCRAAIVEKLFRAGKDLNQKHTFSAIALLDRYLEKYQIADEQIVVAGMSALKIVI